MYQNISISEFGLKIIDKRFAILDVRTKDEFEQGHIDGAKLLDVQDANFKTQIETLDKNAEYLVYCRSGRRSISACSIMQENGFQHLYNVEGGWLAWLEKHAEANIPQKEETKADKHYQILIIGGGNAGISAAALLLRKEANLNIGILEPSAKHYYQPAYTLVAGGEFDVHKTVRNEADLIPDGVTWIQDACDVFHPERNQINTKKGTVISYDYMIVAPGIQLDWHKIKGLEGNVGKDGICSNYTFETVAYTFESVKKMKNGGKAIFHNPNTPIKCGGAPQKTMYLSSDYWRKNGVQIDTHFYSGGGVIFGVPKYANTLNKVIQRYDIKTHFLHNLVEIIPSEKKVIFDVYKDGQVVNQVSDTYDMIHITPPQSAPDFIKKSPLAVPNDLQAAAGCFGLTSSTTNNLGWIDVDKNTLQHLQFTNIFGCGDAANTPNAKTGAALRKQVPVVVENILSMLKHGKLSDKIYNGYGSCPLVTGYGKLVLAEFDYNNTPIETFPFNQAEERWSMYQMKKHLLPWLYWNKILKGQAM